MLVNAPVRNNVVLQGEVVLLRRGEEPGSRVGLGAILSPDAVVEPAVECFATSSESRVAKVLAQQGRLVVCAGEQRSAFSGPRHTLKRQLTHSVAVAQVGRLAQSSRLTQALSAELQGLRIVEEALVEHEDAVGFGRDDHIDRLAETSRVSIAGFLLRRILTKCQRPSPRR